MKNYRQQYIPNIGFFAKETQLQRSMAGQVVRQLMEPKLTGVALVQFNERRAEFVASLRASGILSA